MTTTVKTLLASVIGLVLGAVLSYTLLPHTLVVSDGQSVTLGATSPHQEIFSWAFAGGLQAGRTNQMSVDTSGNLSTTGGATISGVINSGAIIATGAVTSPGVTLNSSASTTLQVGTSGKTGCIELGDAASSTLIGFITFSNGTFVTTTTKPGVCI